MSAAARILIAGHSASAAVFAGLLRHAGYPVTLLGHAWRNHTHLTVHLLGSAYYADGFHFVSATEELSGEYPLILFAETDNVAPLRSRAAPNGLALVLSRSRRTLEAIANIFGAEQTLGAWLRFNALFTAAGQVTLYETEGPTLIGPLEVSDCVLMEQIHSWIRAFQAAHLPCAASADIVSLA